MDTHLEIGWKASKSIKSHSNVVWSPHCHALEHRVKYIVGWVWRIQQIFRQGTIKGGPHCTCCRECVVWKIDCYLFLDLLCFSIWAHPQGFYSMTTKYLISKAFRVLNISALIYIQVEVLFATWASKENLSICRNSSPVKDRRCW